jgi:hypothetical protein
MKKILVILMLVFAFGCSDDAVQPRVNPVVGNWFREVEAKEEYGFDALIMKFNNDGKYVAISVEWEGKNDTLLGNYTYENYKIVLYDEDCKEVPGNYEVDPIDNGLRFILIDDECDRSDLINGFFVKYVEEPKG